MEVWSYLTRENTCVVGAYCDLPLYITRRTPYVKLIVLSCGHEFCDCCTRKMLETRHRQCPLCRARIDPEKIKPLL